MKSKLIVVSVFTTLLVMSTLFAFCSTAQAHEREYEWRHHDNHGWFWAPVIIGGIVGYELAQPRVQPAQPTIITAPPPVSPQYCAYPTSAVYTQVYVIDQYGQQVLTYRFEGCR